MCTSMHDIVRGCLTDEPEGPFFSSSLGNLDPSEGVGLGRARRWHDGTFRSSSKMARIELWGTAIEGGG